MSTQETPPVLQRVLASSTSLRILASAVIVLFLYYAAGVVITILLSVLIAYFLDPAVEYLERLRVPRTIGALIMVVLLIAVLGAAGYGLYDRTSQFAADWPKYREIIRDAFGNIQQKVGNIEGGVTGFTPSSGASQPSGGSSSIHEFLVSGIGSLYALALEGTFVPFLVFFMLAEKREVWHGTLQLFPVSRRTQVKETLEDLRDVLRDYLIGMCVLFSQRDYQAASLFAKTLLHLGTPKEKLLEAGARLAMWMGGLPAADASFALQKAIREYEKEGLGSLGVWFPPEKGP